MKQTVLSLAIVAVLTGCATGSAIREKITGDQFDTPKVEESKFLKKDSNKLQPPEGGPLPVAVYGFRDLTPSDPFRIHTTSHAHTARSRIRPILTPSSS